MVKGHELPTVVRFVVHKAFQHCLCVLVVIEAMQDKLCNATPEALRSERDLLLLIELWILIVVTVGRSEGFVEHESLEALVIYFESIKFLIRSTVVIYPSSWFILLPVMLDRCYGCIRPGEAHGQWATR